MMSNQAAYNDFMIDLQNLADLNKIDLHFDQYTYATYFYRGFKPQCVINDIKDDEQSRPQFNPVEE
jgi:hypothetical protein